MTLSKIYQEKATEAQRDIAQGENIAAAHAYLARFQWCEAHADSLLNRFPEIIAILPGQKSKDSLNNWQIGDSIHIDLGGIKSFDARWVKIQGALQEALIEAGWMETVSYAYFFLDVECCPLQRRLGASFEDLEDLGIETYGAMKDEQGFYIAMDFKNRQQKVGLSEDSIKKDLERIFPDIRLQYHYQWPALNPASATKSSFKPPAPPGP